MFDFDFDFDSALQERLALSLLHFLWLGCLPACVLVLALRIVPNAATTLRYRLSLVALTMTLLMFVASFFIAERQSASRQMAAQRTPGDESSVSEATLRTGNHISIAMLPGVPSANEAYTSRSANPNREAASLPISRNAPVAPIETGSTSAWPAYVVIGYLIGVSGFALRLLAGCWFSRRLRGRATLIQEPLIEQLIGRVATELKLRTTPMVMWCDRAVVPAVIGVLRPVVLLPTSMATGLPVEQLHHILLHEFSHLRRYDPLVNFLQNVIETVLFFHPLVWWVSGQVRLSRELSCDAAVVACGIDSQEYASTLIEIAARSRHSAQSAFTPSAVTVASVSSRSQLRTRIGQLLGRDLRRSNRLSGVAETASLIVVLLLFVSLVFSDRQTTENSSNAVARPQVTEAVTTNAPQNIERTELAGVVVDASGNPISGVTVDAWSWYPGDETITDENGAFRFKPNSDNRRSKVEVRWMKKGYSPHYVAQQPIGVNDLVITLDSSTFIEGTVTATDGTPAANVTVRGEQKNIQGDGFSITAVPTETSTDTSGKYRLYVHPDEYEITITSKAGVVRMANIRLNRGEAITKDISLAEPVRFEAIVVDAISGEPFEGLVLSSFMRRDIEAKSDADGRIVIDGMLPGEFDFAVGAGEPIPYKDTFYYGHGPLGRWWSADAVHAWQQLDMSPTGFQSNFDGFNFNLHVGMAPVKILVEQGVEFSGHVYDPDGNPRGGATVAPAETGSGNSLTGDTRYSVTTKDDGSYRVVMPAGKVFQYNLMAFDGEYGKWRKWGAVVREPLVSTPGQTIDNYDFTLTQGAIVRGKVISNDAATDAPREVRAHAADLNGNRYFDPTVEVAPDGTFELAGLRPGKHWIQVSPFGFVMPDAVQNEASMIVEVKDGEVREGIELKVESSADLEARFLAVPKQDFDLPANVPTLDKNAGGVIFETDDKIFSVPCFDQKSMYFGAVDGPFYCLDKVTGELRWKREDFKRVDSNPVIAGGIVYFANMSNTFFALRADNGETVWKAAIAGCGYNNPVLHDDLVWIGGTDAVIALDPKTGDAREIYTTGVKSGDWSSVQSTLQGNRLVASGDWSSVQITLQGNRLVAFVTTDYESNEYTGTGKLVCFTRGNENAAWNVPWGSCSFGSIVADSTRCYFGTRDGFLNAVRLEDGTAEWKFDCRELFADRKQVWPDSGIVDVGDGLVLTVDHQRLNEPGALTCIDKASGKLRWAIVNPYQFSDMIAPASDSLFSVTLDHRLIRVAPQTGKIQYLGQLPTPNPNHHAENYSVSVSDGFVYITGADAKVHRYKQL